MNKNRLEAFSDGVLAIIVTIMVLELKAPHTDDWKVLLHMYPEFLSYILSFLMVWIYWNNHHHLFQSVHKINGGVLLANGFLLFTLSLLPFATAWLGSTHFSTNATILMGIVLLLCRAAYSILTNRLIHANGDRESTLAKALGKDFKGNISLAGYSFAIIIAFFMPYISFIIYGLIALMWLIPDKRIEKII
ncbi:MAG: TMEM175 family protein [Chitinophagaceae bacterium]|nr:TMEM175 family protein [Chitinophagaceae bacterium]